MDTEETLSNNNITSEDIDGVPNDASGVSDSNETLPQQVLFAIGGETEEQSSSTLVEDGSKPQEERSAQQPSQFHEEKNWAICNCGTATAYVNGVIKCPVCGKDINIVVEESTSTTSTSETESLSQTLVTGMAIVPQTSELFEGDQLATSSKPVYQHTRRAVLDGSRIPSEGDSETSVQIPCAPCCLTLYILKQHFPQRNEQQVSIHFAENLEQTRIPSWINQMEQTQGIKLASFGDEHSSQQQNNFFHPLCLKDGITVKFELVKQMHRKFRIRYEQPTHEIPLHRIKSLCQHRIPGATLQVRIESLCEPGEVCQDHLRMTMRNGETIHKYLIPIWSSGQS